MTFRVAYFIWVCFSDLILDDTIFRLIYIFRRHHPSLANVTGRFSCGIIIRVFAQHALEVRLSHSFRREEDAYFQTSEAGLRDDGCDFYTHRSSPGGAVGRWWFHRVFFSLFVCLGPVENLGAARNTVMKAPFAVWRNLSTASRSSQKELNVPDRINRLISLGSARFMK